jgi:hypothetical protein
MNSQSRGTQWSAFVPRQGLIMARECTLPPSGFHTSDEMRRMNGKTERLSTGTGEPHLDRASANVAPVEQPVRPATMVGAEMLNWSDLEPPPGRLTVGGPAASSLLDAVVGKAARVLLAGPHTLELIEQVAARATAVDILLRSFPDAEAVAERLRDRPARVFTGGLDRFGQEHGEASYDVVVALDGMTRLLGTDSAALAWTDALRLLQSRVAPAGRLLLGAPNVFGLGRLLDVPDQLPGDDEWGRNLAGTAEPPGGLDEITAALADAGLALETRYDVFPNASAPELAFVRSGPAAKTLIARATARHYAGRPTLADPYRLVADAVAAGHGTALAPGYWFVLRADTVPQAGTAPELPDRLGIDSDVPADELVEELLIAATRADDHQALRRTVKGYVDWLLDTDHTTAAEGAADNVLTDGSSYTLLQDGTGTPGGTQEQLVVRHLARFVARAMAAGGRWPWPAGGTPRSQTVRLAAMAGKTVDDVLWESAGVADEPFRPQGGAEQLATIARLSAELADARAQVDWFEGQLDKLRRSRSYRVGRAIVSPLRAAYGKFRSRVR